MIAFLTPVNERTDATGQSSFRGTQVRDDGSGPMIVAHRQRVVVISGPDRGLECEIESTRLAVGTSSKNDLALTDKTVSRRHCEISVRNDRYFLHDLDSTNGTELNGTPVVEAFLSPGARIRVGDTELLFEPKKKWERIADDKAGHFGAMYGRSQVMGEVFALLNKVARTDLSCILVGETGTGKELAARAIHDHSDRRNGSFIIIDCGAVSRTLIESELFGHEKGAFTGADRHRMGAFEASDGGTIFLDEIGELSIDLQPKLLRALERREIKRLGSTRHLEIDVRVIAATHRDLHDMIKKGEFREDLYYRLAEVVVELPPLRERRDDVGVIAQRIFEEFATDVGGASAMSVEAVKELEARLWPGNVRELRNVLRRAMAMCATGTVEVADLNLRGAERVSSRPPALTDGGVAGVGPTAPAPEVADNLPIKEARERWVAPMERAYLERLVRRCRGDLDRAATEAGIHRKSLERLLRQHGLKASDLR